MITFNGVDLSLYMIVNDIKGRGIASHDVSTLTATGMDGSYYERKRLPSRTIEVAFTITSVDANHLRENIDKLNEIFDVSEPVPIIFGDEPDRIYYGVPEGSSEDGEFVRWHKGKIVFLCPDPYKYGPEKTVETTSDNFNIENDGTTDAEPIIELTATEKATFAMISNGVEEYNLIGTPADDDVQVVDSRTSVLYENGSTINTWSTATPEMVDNHFIKKIDGTMGTDGAGIRANGYGTGDELHGPAVFKEINPIQDFEIETTFDIISRREVENFRMGINFFDENMNMLGHIGIKDNSRNYKRRTPLARYGPYRGSGRSNGNLIGDSQKNDQARETTLFYLRAKREGNTFDFYIGEWQSHRHIRSWHERYRDINNEYIGRLKYITLYIASYADRVTPSRLRINSVEVFELTKATVDQTPYIIYPGDVVTFDHADNDILINGESRKDLKNFGGSFFTLKKGINTLTVTPENTFDTVIKYQERFR